ncbi:anhydro-N-acetylmuramic acid kinase [Ideonella sp. TBM-1]|uniref:Anhydro-N-acetylmuramic acid kinase n=2 Tax=Ideonella livida TaxID=2707176 RepID=A0A7C9PIB5_9BURK|nr:anhydro-N-acetylmuramic acid kinase [Ideonella livida]
MSGTSLDGVDGVLARLPATGGLQVLTHAHRPMPEALRATLLALNSPGADELHHAALAANALTRLQAQVVDELLARAGLPAREIRAIGSHGQTVRHRPGEFDGLGYTLQLNQPALLAELTGIDVAHDFRPRDLAAGGQGAPLVPAFHALVFGRATEHRAVLNLGGIANLTLLPPAAAHSTAPDGPVTGFDCGPANALLDGWCQRHLGTAYDAAGRWSAGGQVHATLLARCLAEPFFARRPPKSTGRDLFHEGWLAARLDGLTLVPQDVQATLAELSAQAAAQALRREAPHCAQLLVCGGGALNDDLMARLRRALPGLPVRSTDSQGLPPLQVEAAAFAWLASALCRRVPASLPEVTGARGPRLLGSLTPA